MKPKSFSGFVLAGISAIAAFLFFQSEAHAAPPTYFGSGTFRASTAAITNLNFPAGMLANDVCLLAAESENQAISLGTANGFVQVPTWSPQSAGTAAVNPASRLALFWKRMLGGDTAPTLADSGDHTTGQIHCFRGVDPAGNPWDTGAGGIDGGANDASGTIPGATTTLADTLVVLITSNSRNGTGTANCSVWANASLTSLTERSDNTNTAGLGGGHCMATGIKATAGAYNQTTLTLSATSYKGAISLALKPKPTTTLATGSDPAAATIAPGTAATDVNQFTLQTDSGTEAITSVTVNLSTNSGVGRLAITDSGGGEYGFTASPVAGANIITVAGMSATTALTTFKVRVTPLGHVAMPAVPGAAYAITAPVTAWVGPNTHAGSDTNPNALTIDNLSPSGATGTSGSAGTGSVTLGWTTSASTDFSITDGSVLYRWTTTAGSEVPVEGSAPTVNSSNGTATVACVLSSAASFAYSGIIDGTGGSAGCSTTALTNGTTYVYKIFQKDTSGNYDVGVVIGILTPYGLCFDDSFAGTLGTNWSVGSQSGGFTPAIVSGRLRLTDATTGQTTWATLQRLIPAAGNKVTVEFDYFAYGGTGADGMAVVFSDASVAPVAGAFGGSLGYAQKNNPGSDCVIVGGCPGFAGGWLGVALDEYGNFSNPTEGRYGGTGQVIDSVSIRGSGTGVSGYRFLQGTAMLSPGIDGNNVPPGTVAHRYRVIIDHTDNVHAYVSVERDTTSGAGTAYTSLIAPFDVKDPGYSQSAIPVSFNLSFTGSTGTSTNIHEIGNLSTCTEQPLVAPTLHHIEIDHGGSACTSSAAPVTVKACANADCTALYLDNVTVDLTPNAGGGRTWTPAEPVTFSGGSAAMTLANTTANTQTLGGTATSPTTGNATRCFNGVTETCSLTFSDCTVDAVEVSATSVAGTPIFTKLAGTTFNLHAVRTGGGNQNVSLIELVDASSGICSTYPALTSTISPATFTLSGGNPRQVVAFTYNDAAPNVRVRMTTGGGVKSCSSDNFAIRPQTFTVNSSSANNPNPPPGGTILRAGMDPFSLTVTAVYGVTPTSSYSGTPLLNASLIFTNLANLGAVAAATFPAASSGVSTANGLKYDEVGNFNLDQYAVYDDAFATVDSIKGECITGFSNVLDVNGKYSCQFGSATAGPFGRFVPDHFTVMSTVSNACVAGTFTYMGQSFTLSPAGVVEARNFANGVTANYAGAYAPGSVTFGAENADNGIDLGGSLVFSATGLPLSGTWTAGIFTLTGGATAVTFARQTTPSGPLEQLNTGLTVTDTDVATAPRVAGADFNPGAIGGTASYKSFDGSPLKMRYGRLRLINAYGSELLKLRVEYRAEYWDGSRWTTNANDQCSAIADANIAIGNAGTLIPTVSSITQLAAGTGGVGFIIFNKTNQPGSFDIALDMGGGTGNTLTVAAACESAGWAPNPTNGANLSYLAGRWCGSAFDKYPVARIKFGSPKAPYIYLRERY